jgi:hypothetical protein
VEDGFASIEMKMCIQEKRASFNGNCFSLGFMGCSHGLSFIYDLRKKPLDFTPHIEKQERS